MDKSVKILIVGNDVYSIYEKAIRDALVQLGYHNVAIFGYEEYLHRSALDIPCLDTVSYKIQNKFSLGHGVRLLNRELLNQCRENKPDLVFLYRCRAVYPKTVKKIRESGCMVFSYNNDNPFSAYYPGYFWRHYRKSLPYCDAAFVYREDNIHDCHHCGCKRVEILRSYYISGRNYFIEDGKVSVKVPQVLFLGHFEQDGRGECLEALAESGIVVGVHDGWRGKINAHNIVFLSETGGERYNEMLNAAEIALVFLSVINGDTYTRRCFEIPAAKTMMLSVYTEDLASMFEPDKEAVFFRSKEELVEKTAYYLRHPEACKRIGQAGYERLIRDGHEAKDRALQIINKYIEIKAENNASGKDE